MLLHRDHLRQALLLVLSQRIDQGADLDLAGFSARIDAASDSYDALYELALELRDPPARADWSHVEPLAWEGIVAESEQLEPHRRWPRPDLSRAAGKAAAGFLGSVCGCVLGKPVEMDPTLAELRQAAEAAGEWPIDDYISENLLENLGRRHDSWRQTTRGRIAFVAADDDIHYTILGMLLLEEYGPGFTQENLFDTWVLNIPSQWAWGPERTALLDGAMNQHHFFPESPVTASRDVLLLNPGDEMCGALIRADAYGYACPGNPDLAAWLAWKDASFTHIKTGVYGAMFVAALIALCHDADGGLSGNDRLELITGALRRIPRKSRFAGVVRDCLARIQGAPDWESGYAAVHGRYRDYSHCQVFQEIGTLINTLKFARDTGHGIGLQVSQGNDTDSFGATAGSVLGVLFGEASLDARWLVPFNNRIQPALADFHEERLDAVAARIARLPAECHARATASHRGSDGAIPGSGNRG